MFNIDEQYIIQNFESALKNGHIKAYYQPVIRTLTGKVCGVEALARWEDPVAGILSPYLFINVLEKNRLIHKLDLRILENICETYNYMKSADKPLHPFSINLSRLDFNEVDMLKEIGVIIEKYNVPSDAIHIEITESVMLDNTAYFHRIFDSFHDAGFEIFMDDFGSGYSSLNVLKDYCFDVLKIDMRFLSDIGSRSKKILSSVVNMAKAIGIHTLAEGVETIEQMQFLRAIGCEMLQGFYYSKPLNEIAYAQYIEKAEVEDPVDKEYWNTVGKLNFLSTNPLKEYLILSTSENDPFASRINNYPLALIEYYGKSISYQYTNSAFINEVHKLGFSSIEEIEKATNQDIIPEFFQRFYKQLDLTCMSNTIQKTEWVMSDIYFTLKTKFIARTKDKCMIAASLYTGDPEIIDNHSDYIRKYSQNIFSTYELVTVTVPEKSLATKIYSSYIDDKNYSPEGNTAASTLSQNMSDYTNNEVHPDDRVRHAAFTDYTTFEQRMQKYGQNFIQQPFRIRTADNKYTWKNIRITRLSSTTDKKYIITLQALPPYEIKCIDTIFKEHPEYFVIDM